MREIVNFVILNLTGVLSAASRTRTLFLKFVVL